ncbi:MAG: hypothetical protein AAB516_00665 [Patescibacteria group bacterium]
MDEQFSSTSTLMDKFKLNKKWFWVGIAVAFFNVVGGLIYGIALTLEKEHRNEGLIIIGFSIVWGIFNALVVLPWLLHSGVFTKFQPAFR